MTGSWRRELFDRFIPAEILQCKQNWMSGDDFVLPVCETLQLLLSETKNSDKDTRVVLVLQTRSFFEQIIPLTQPDSTFLPDVVQNVHLMFAIVNSGLKSFLQDEGSAEGLEKLISVVEHSHISVQFGQDLSIFVLGFICSDFTTAPGHKKLFPCIGAFFENSVFPPFFEAMGGLLAIWDLLVSAHKDELCGLVFDKLSQTIHLYFQADETSDYVNFLVHVSKTLSNLPEKNAPNAFQFLFDLLSNAKHDLLNVFIEIGGFRAINGLIVSRNDLQLLIVYQMFRPICVSKSDGDNPILGQLIELIQSPEASSELKKAGMLSLYNTIRQMDQKVVPLQLHQLYTLAVGLTGDCVVTFVDMCYFMASHFDLDMTALLPAISKLFTPTTALEYNISSLFSLFQLLGSSFKPFAAMFYGQITKDATPSEFAGIANKYSDFLTFLPLAFFESNVNKAWLLEILIRSASKIQNREQYLYSLASVMEGPQMMQIATDVFLSLVKERELAKEAIELLSRAAMLSAELRKALMEMGIVAVVRQMYESGALDTVTILNLCASLSGGHFDIVCDTTISSFLKSVDYFGLSEDAMLKLAFGLQQDETDLRMGHLCYPSLLHKCGNFDITYNYDLWICGQYGLDSWMRETGRPISEFPCILKVARRFLLPCHVPLMFDHPHLFAEACDDTFGLVPLFEFVKDAENSLITVRVPFADKSISFWINFRDYPPTCQQVCAADGVLFKAENDEFRANDQILIEYSLRKWYHVVLVLTDKGKLQVFIDQALVYTGATTIHDEVVTFSSNEQCQAGWFIGGAIRIFDSVIGKDKVADVFRAGLRDTISREAITIQPSTFVKLFDGRQKASLAEACENVRPVLSYPLSNHIKTSYNGNRGIFGKILELLADGKVDDCRDFLNALCNLQAQNLSKWSRQLFSLHISMLIHMCPDLVDVKTFDNIIKSFTFDDNSKETFDWLAFLTILMDFGLLNSSLRSYMISSLYGIVAQFPPSDSKSLLGIFVFQAFHLIDFTEEEKVSFGALITRFGLRATSVSRLIASLPDFGRNLSVPSLKYEPSDDSPLYYQLLDMLGTFIDYKFDQLYLLHVIPSSTALGFISQMISSAIGGNKLGVLDRELIARFCVTFCYIPKAWSCILSLLLGTVCDAEMSFEFVCKSFDSSVFPSFLLMVSLLLTSAIEMSETSYWRKLGQSMLSLLNNNVDKISLFPVKPELVLAITQLLSFGLLKPSITIYPFATPLADPKEVIECSLKNGQQFPDGEPQSCPFPAFQTYGADADLMEKVHKLVISKLPEKIKILPGTAVDASYQDYNLSFCAKAINLNRMEKWSDWQDFLKSVRAMFGLCEGELEFSAVIKSEIFEKILNFVAGILVKAMTENCLLDFLPKILLTNTHTIPAYSICLMERIVSLVFEEMSQKKIFSIHMLQFTCKRIREGWFANIMLSVITLMLLLCDICERPVPDCLADILIDGFDLVAEKDLSAYLSVFITYSNSIFSPSVTERTDFFILLVDRLIVHYPLCPKIVPTILEALLAAAKSNEELNNRWMKNVLPTCPDCDLNMLLSGLAILQEKGIEAWNSWCKENVILEMDLTKLRKRENIGYSQARETAVLESLTKISDFRIQMSSTFFTSAHKLLADIHDDMTISKAACAVIRDFQRERLLLSVSYFLRQRETLLTAKYRFDISQSNLKALTLLSDPLIPAKRVEQSPMVYDVPPFPGGNCTSVQPKIPEIHELLPLLPEKLRDLMTTPYFQFEDFIFHTKKQLKLSFSQLLPISDSMNLAIVQIIWNNGNKFENMWDLSLLYGVDPIPGIALKTSDSILFVEGMQLTETGIRYRYSETPRILYTFYMSYFIAGHFGPCALMGAHPVVRWPANEVIYCCQHYWLHRPTAVEVNFISGWSFILIPELAQFPQFFSMWKRMAEETLARFPKPRVFSPLNSAYLLRRKDHGKLWQEGQIDNFTYLAILNRLGCRSLADYTQYYVFPWVVGDYNSNSLDNAPIESFRNLRLPMGQIGEERAPRFDAIFEDSGEYFYGTHYMHLGVVLYFMFRIDPFCLFSIYLHHGWDHPNRLFYDVYETWMAAAYTSPADVKELIPEFFCVPEFLTNVGNLPLTTTTDMKDVANVNLGNWCKNPYDFVHKMQHFLQCDMVTQHLPFWIDLIFGVKSRGEAAIAAKNLFHPLCYVKRIEDEEAIESDDQIEREAAITCIINFGQCCMQLFTTPHPTPNRMYHPQHIMTNPDMILYQRLNPQMVSFPISDVKIRENELASTTGISILLPPFFSTDVSLDSARLCISVSHPKPHSIFANDFLDSTSTFSISKDGVFMGIGQVEGSVSLYILKYANSSDLLEAQFIDRFPTSGSVSLISISSPHFLMLAVSGSVITCIDIGTRRLIEPITAKARVNCVAFDNHAGLIIGGGSSFLNVWSLSGSLIIDAKVDSSVICMDVAELSETVPNRFFVTGHANGMVKFWTINYAELQIVCLKALKLTQTMIKKVSISDDAMKVVAATNDDVYCFDYFGSSAKNMKKAYAVECSQCKSRIEKTTLTRSVKTCANCHRFFCKDCLPNERLFSLGQASSATKRKFLCPHCLSVKDSM